MAATSFQRGNPIQWNSKKWIYSNDRSSTKKEKPCIRCGRMPTKEGYDACLGYISNAKSACCGHGVEEGFII
jgi:hypothetical protein